MVVQADTLPPPAEAGEASQKREPSPVLPSSSEIEAAVSNVRVCGLRLGSGLHGPALFCTLAACALFTAIAFAALQESVFKLEGFHFGGWVTFITSVSYCLCAGVELALAWGAPRKGAMRDYCLLSFFTLSGMYLTNWAMEYLNYTTRIVCKSSKVVPTMILGTLLQGRRYGASEYASAALLVLGVSLFCLGDVTGAPNFHVRGLVLIAGALFADAATSNFEEKRFFRVPDPVGQPEVIFYSSLLGSGASLLILLSTGELGPALQHSMANTGVVPLLSAAAVCGYLSLTCVLLLIKLYGATNTEIVKSLRKVLSIALSFAVYPKQINAKYVAGFSATIASLVLTLQIKKRKAERRALGVEKGGAAVPV